MLMMNGMPRCSATCATAGVCTESKAPASALAPSWIRRLARVRAASALLSVSAFMISMSTPSTCLRTAGAMSAPFWQDWPISACTPERGSSTPTLSFCACACAMPNGDRAEATPAAATLLLNCLRSIFPPPRVSRVYYRSMPVVQEISEGRVPVKVHTGEIEPAARQQLVNVSNLPIVHHHVAAMPDVHLGIVATVGWVMPTLKAIIPAAVGVDIGCGMIAARLSLSSNEFEEKSLRKIFDQISRDVPVGFNQHDERDARDSAARPFERKLKQIKEKHPGIEKRVGKQSSWVRQMGSLGGGNHFIEVCLDEAGRAWVMLHSGSRGIGNAIGTYFIELAKKDLGKTSIQIPARNIADFPEGAQHFDDYVEAVGWAQDYAAANRAEMMELVLEALRRHLPAFEVTGAAVDCPHNYVERETRYGEAVWVTRKGAIPAG